MRTNKRKKGISLIVLIITIIVMIILAAAIILSLNNSGIIDRANKAKTDSDTANLKEYVNVLEAEWELGTKETSKEAYVNEKLNDKGYNAVYSGDGKIYTGTAAEFLKNDIQIGATVTGYTLSSKNTTGTDGAENTAYEEEKEGAPQPATNIKRDENITWKYMGIDDNGIALIVGSVTSSSPKLTIGGKGGYNNGKSALNKVCADLYSSDDMGSARSMTIDDVVKILEYTGGNACDTDPELVKISTSDGKMSGAWIDYYDSDYTISRRDLIFPSSSNEGLTTSYVLASPCRTWEYTSYSSCHLSGFYAVTSTSCKVSAECFHDDCGIGAIAFNHAVRPVVELFSDLTVTKNADGSVVLSK